MWIQHILPVLFWRSEHQKNIWPYAAEQAISKWAAAAQWDGMSRYMWNIMKRTADEFAGSSPACGLFHCLPVMDGESSSLSKSVRKSRSMWSPQTF
jgi:hypothetical protein